MSMPVPITYIPNNGGYPIPCFPGAYYVNSGSSSTGLEFAVPIYGSMNFNSYNFENLDDYFWLLPGYKIEIFNSSSTLIFTFINTTNKITRNATFGTLPNNAYSCKLYYNTGSVSTPVWVEITNVYTVY